MTKDENQKPVWEETWVAERDSLFKKCADGSLVEFAQLIGSSRSPLAAQAPAMARLLLDVCCCPACGFYVNITGRQDGHSKECELIKVLKAAGVPTDGSSWGEEK